jgi:hypothetical protein
MNQHPADTPAPTLRAFTPRALIIGLLLVVGFTVAGSLSVLTRYEIMGTGYLPRGVMALLLLLILANTLVGKFKPKVALTRRELLVIFIMLAIMAAIPGQEFGQHVYLNLLGMVYYATPEIAPPGLYLDSLSPYLVPSLDRAAPAIRWAYEGLPAGQGVPWQGWLMPLLVWTPFFLALYWMLLCFAALLSRRWEQQERLLYPLIQVPMELTDSQPRQSPLLRNPLLWVAFALACLPYLSKGLHSYYPMIPDLNLQKDSGTLFPGGPMVAFNNLPLHFYPEMTGISYLLSSEVAFSVWFFYLLRIAQSAARIGIGLNTNHAQFAEMQTIGGYLVLALALLWSARRYLGALVRTLLTRDDPDPSVTPAERMAFWGLLAGFAFVLWWSSQVGLAIGWAAVLMGLFPLVSVVVSRVVCEAGMFIYASPFRLDQVLFRLIGVKYIGAANVTIMSMMSWAQIRSTATQFMPQAFQCLKIGSLIEAPRKRTVVWMIVAVGLAILVSHLVVPMVIYNYGVFRLGWWPQGSGLSTTNRLASDLRSTTRPGAEDWIGMATGGAFTFFLVQMRQRFVWWPFHPLGYGAWLGWPTERYWLSIFLGWIIKLVVVRFGGYQGFQRLKPGAYGLILGVTSIVTFWIVFHFFVPGVELIRE